MPSEVNLLLQHIIVQDQDGQNNNDILCIILHYNVYNNDILTCHTLSISLFFTPKRNGRLGHGEFQYPCQWPQKLMDLVLISAISNYFYILLPSNPNPRSSCQWHQIVWFERSWSVRIREEFVFFNCFYMVYTSHPYIFTPCLWGLNLDLNSKRSVSIFISCFFKFWSFFFSVTATLRCVNHLLQIIVSYRN